MICLIPKPPANLNQHLLENYYVAEILKQVPDISETEQYTIKDAYCSNNSAQAFEILIENKPTGELPLNN